MTRTTPVAALAGVVLLALPMWSGPAAAQKPVDGEATRSGERGVSRPSSAVRYVFAGIGIDRYDDPAWPDLANAGNDLEAVRQTLTTQYGFYSTPELVVRDEGADESAVKKLVRGTLQRMLRPEDRLVLFYAGHGASTTDTIGAEELRHTGHIVPHGATGESWSWIRLKDFLGWVDDLPAQQVLVVLDACMAGFALPDDLKPREEEETLPLEEVQTRRARRVLVSAKALQLAADGGAEFPGNSLFTGWLTDGLRREAGGGGAAVGGANRDGDTVVSSWELFHFVRERLQAGGAKQTPAFGAFSGADNGGQLVFPLAVAPEDAAYDRAIAALGGDVDAFVASAESAMALLPENDSRAAYLAYRLADEQGKQEATRDALLRLKEFADAGTEIPMNRQLVDRHLDLFCKALGGCTAKQAVAARVGL